MNSLETKVREILEAYKLCVEMDWSGEGYMGIHPILSQSESTTSLLVLIEGEVAGLKSEKEKMREALMWMSGSNDFGPGGQAREGFLKNVYPLISNNRIVAHSSGEGK